MPNTYTQIHLQIVMVVKYRAALIQPSWEEELKKYITGIVQKNGHKLLVINGMPDHMHMVIGLRPSQSVSELMQDVKGSSSKWINESRFVKGHFEWQQGYGAFSYSKSVLHHVINYVQEQKAHHAKLSFQKEYLELLKEFEVEYDEKYLFAEPQ